MKIRNNDELKLFEETLDRCDASVLVVTALAVVFIRRRFAK